MVSRFPFKSAKIDKIQMHRNDNYYNQDLTLKLPKFLICSTFGKLTNHKLSIYAYQVWYISTSLIQDRSSILWNILTATSSPLHSPRCTSPNLPFPVHTKCHKECIYLYKITKPTKISRFGDFCFNLETYQGLEV